MVGKEGKRMYVGTRNIRQPWEGGKVLNVDDKSLSFIVNFSSCTTITK